MQCRVVRSLHFRHMHAFVHALIYNTQTSSSSANADYPFIHPSHPSTSETISVYKTKLLYTVNKSFRPCFHRRLRDENIYKHPASCTSEACILLIRHSGMDLPAGGASSFLAAFQLQPEYQLARLLSLTASGFSCTSLSGRGLPPANVVCLSL